MVIVAMACLVTIGTGTPVGLIAAYSFVLGAGLGLLLSTSMLVGAQTAVGWGRRGIATSTNVFFRMFGSAASAAVFGAVSDTVLRQRLQGAPRTIRSTLPATVNDITAQLRTIRGPATAASPVARYLMDSLRDSTVTVFAIVLGTCVVGAAIMLLVRGGDRPASIATGESGGPGESEDRRRAPGPAGKTTILGQEI